MSKSINLAKRPTNNFQSPTKTRPLLIFGNAATGKSTLGRQLVVNHVLDVCLEVDEFWRFVSGEDHAWRMSNPNNESNRRLKNEVVSRCLTGLLGRYSVGLTGVWPGESQPILEKLQDYCVIVLDYKQMPGEPAVPADICAERFIARGQTRDDLVKSGILPHFEENQRSLLRFAYKALVNGRLCEDPEVLKYVWEGSKTLPEKVDMTQTTVEGGIERNE